MMLRIALPIGFLALSLVFLAGCFNLEVKEPLVNLGEDEYQKEKVRDPAPGVPDSDLNREQRLQRELARCQYMLDISEKKNKKLKEEYEKEKDRLEDQIERLENNNEDLLKENRKLRKELRD